MVVPIVFFCNSLSSSLKSVYLCFAFIDEVVVSLSVGVVGVAVLVEPGVDDGIVVSPFPHPLKVKMHNKRLSEALIVFFM